MQLCNSGEEETQEHMETCESTTELREGLNLKIEREHIILWRKINRKLFKEYNDVSSIEAKLVKTTQTTMRHPAEEGRVELGTT